MIRNSLSHNLRRPPSCPEIGPARRSFSISQLPLNALYNACRKLVPKLSPTERAALDAGTVGFDRNIFSGKPSLYDLDKYASTSISADESAFLNNEVNDLCELLDDYKISNDRELPQEFWDRCKSQGFFGMVIPKEFGGKGFSGAGHSAVVQKISTRSTSAAGTVTIPNSVGPGELLMRYGTEAQKHYFLPRLSSGALVPCFALTSPHSGSDAASSTEASGEVVEWNGQLGIVASFNKRYITLAPIAGLVGLSFMTKDPKGLLKGKGGEGITIALLERDHEGLVMGERHDPLNVSFMNGPVTGKDVFIPMDKILGGQTRIGYGWNMLMECLAEGRAVSLPASAVGGARMALNYVGAYARIRKQFKVPIAEMGGVQEALSRIASQAYILASAQALINSMLLNHEQPAVLSAVMKSETTHRTRLAINDAMDIVGGAGICRGPNNLLGNGYMALPIAVTVEGANILTRCLIIFGQGLNRAHPNLIHIINSLQKGDDAANFGHHLTAFFQHLASNSARSLFASAVHFPERIAGVYKRLFQKDSYIYGNKVDKMLHSITSGSRNSISSDSGSGSDKDSKLCSEFVDHYSRLLARRSSNFAACADLSLALGGRLKFEEMISGRFADAFGSLYLGYACLWYYKKNKSIEGCRELCRLSLDNLMEQNETALLEISKNFPYRPIGWMMRALVGPKPSSGGSSDLLRRLASELITRPTAIRAHLSEGIFISKNPNDFLHKLNKVLPDAVKADYATRSAKLERRDLTGTEKELVSSVTSVVDELIQVDSFSKIGAERYEPDTNYVRPALRGSRFVVKKCDVI